MTATWRFRTMEEDQKHVEPTHREHLATDGVVGPLVRESIQNSLDVTQEGKATQVVFTIGSTKAANVEEYFSGLEPHLKSITRSLSEGMPESGEDIAFLAVEDYQTSGLIGDPLRRNELNLNGTKNHFFRFWHRVGPANEFKRRGSWGVGKVVFSNASRIRTFFGATLRDGDESPLLMGEAGLTIHKLPGSDAVYDWYGYFAAHKLEQDVHGNDRHTLLPIQNMSTVNRFTTAFSLRRNTTGLSILVPYIRDEVKFDELARSVIEQYFLPILAGRLEVTVRDGCDELSITHATIDEAVSKLKWPAKGASSQPEIIALLNLARWQLGLQIEEYVLLKPIGTDGSYCLSKDAFSEGVLISMSDAFAANKRVAARLPVFVRSKQGINAQEEVLIVLERDETLRTSNVPHLRSGINISRLRSRGVIGTRGLLVVGGESEEEQGLLDKLLQASEGPAHMNWEQQGEGYDKAKSLYPDAYKVIQFMKNVVRSLNELLANPHDDRDTRTLATFFPDYSAEGNASGGNKGRKKKPGVIEPGAPPFLPPGVIEITVQTIVPSVLAIEGAAVNVRTSESPAEVLFNAITDGAGTVRCEGLAAGKYQINAAKDGIGECSTTVVLPSDKGMIVTLVLRPPPVAKMFTKIRLEDGFCIRGNTEFKGTLCPVRVRLAYAAWGGSKSHNPADFTLGDSHITMSYEGIQEIEIKELIRSPNVLQFTPSVNEFCVQVTGFDKNRALHADARTLEGTENGEGDE